MNTLKKALLELYNQVTPEQQAFFRRIHSHKDPDKPISEIIDGLSQDKIISSIGLCERTITNNEKK
jgi:hypothetical protein